MRVAAALAVLSLTGCPSERCDDPEGTTFGMPGDVSICSAHASLYVELRADGSEDQLCLPSRLVDDEPCRFEVSPAGAVIIFGNAARRGAALHLSTVSVGDVDVRPLLDRTPIEAGHEIEADVALLDPIVDGLALFSTDLSPPEDAFHVAFIASSPPSQE